MKLEDLLKKAKLNRLEKADAKAWFNGIKPVDQKTVVELISNFLKNSNNPILTKSVVLKDTLKKYKLDSRIPNFGVYAVGSTVTGNGQYNDIDVVWADPRFALESDFVKYVSSHYKPHLEIEARLESRPFKITYVSYDLAEALIRIPGRTPVHIGIPKGYETLHWMGAVQKFAEFLTPRQYEATKEFKAAKAVVLFRSK